MTCPIVIASIIESFATAAVMLVLVLGILLLNDRFIRRSRKKKKSAAEMEFEQRVKEPKFDELEKHFGRAFPQCIKALYDNSDEISRQNFQVIAKLANDDETIWNIAYYEPADLQSILDGWEGTKEVFEFANDGCGNIYALDPLLDNPPVMFRDHEIGEWEKVSDSFSQFMSMPRRASKIFS